VVSRLKSKSSGAAKDFGALAGSLPARKFNPTPLSSDDARTFASLLDDFKQLDLGYPENSREFFRSLGMLLDHLAKDILTLNLGTTDPRLFCAYHT
jgi:hypothetical protein